MPDYQKHTVVGYTVGLEIEQMNFNNPEINRDVPDWDIWCCS